MTENTAEHKEKNEISYHNKDVLSKTFGENLKNKSFAAYGLKLPKIVEVLPTNLPTVEANELRMDNLFRLEDNSLALVDYESTYSYEDKIKYLNYIVRTLKRNWKEGDISPPIRMIVIYTGNIKRDNTQPKLDIGCLQFTVEEIFLSELDAEMIEVQLDEKIRNNEELTEEDEMQLILLPLIYRCKEEQQRAVHRCFEKVKGITDESRQIFVLSGLLVFTDKIIEKEVAEEIRGWIEMTKVGRIIQEEINQAVAEVEAEKVQIIKSAQKEKKAAIKETRRETKKETKRKTSLGIAAKMKARGMTTQEIMQLVTGITQEEIEKL
ncbi:hypothetical protein [Blautia sp. HCP28S3_G10]|uniref:hypothetical protein n=1 Tax=Blautia sp. HCP28S3_G10 TaxID=3438908 RepID=UPI003F889AAD